MTYKVNELTVTVHGEDGVYECEVHTRSGAFIINGFSNLNELSAIKNAFNSLRSSAVCRYKASKAASEKW